MPRLKRAFANLALSVLSLLAFGLFAEFVLFRLVLEPSDMPAYAFIDDVIRLQPNQTGVRRVRDEIAAPFTINSQGWNSGRGDYRTERNAGVGRIAILGDSFVEALQVPATESLAEQLERSLAPEPWEVYRFGVAGAPLSQHLLMLEKVVAPYAPDLIVIVLIHNDFLQSFELQPKLGAPWWRSQAFRWINVREGRVVAEMPPAWAPPWWQNIVQSATSRYLHFRMLVDPRRIRERLFGQPSGKSLQANIDMNAVNGRFADVETVADYLFGRLRATAKSQNTRLVLLMDGDRQSLYSAADPRALEHDGALRLNAMVARLSARHEIDFIDLHPRFAADWAQHHQRFDFKNDNHWNERGHGVAAAAIREYLQTRPKTR
jgi:hypothetical protein